MRLSLRIIIALLLLLIAALCIFQAIAAVERPEVKRTYWLIDGVIGLASVSTACRLLWPMKRR